jgi:hypothetical protein
MGLRKLATFNDDLRDSPCSIWKIWVTMRNSGWVSV